MPTDRIANWRQELQELTERYRSAFGDLPPEALNWKPAPDRWSIAQVLDHLLTLHRSYFPTFHALAEGTYQPGWATRIPLLPGLIGRLLLQSVQPETRRATRTVGIWQPAQSDLPADIVEQFTAGQRELAQALELVEPHLGKGVLITSPANAKLPYPLDVGVEALLAHLHRHLRQAQDVKTAWAKAQAAADGS